MFYTPFKPVSPTQSMISLASILTTLRNSFKLSAIIFSDGTWGISELPGASFGFQKSGYLWQPLAIGQEWVSDNIHILSFRWPVSFWPIVQSVSILRSICFSPISTAIELITRRRKNLCTQYSAALIRHRRTRSGRSVYQSRLFSPWAVALRIAICRKRFIARIPNMLNQWRIRLYTHKKILH